MRFAYDFIKDHAEWLRRQTRGLRRPIGRGYYLSGADYAGRDLRCADLIGADVRGADFSSSNLSGADFTGADITGARFHRANLGGTDGIRYATISDGCGKYPVGQMIAVDHGKEGVIVHVYGFRGSFDAASAYVAQEENEEHRARTLRVLRMLREMMEDAP
jgi:hypothetical protein